MSGQIVDFFDRDFRELYAMSREIKLFKEFSVSKPSKAPSTRVTIPTRPTLPVTSRFQVSLGERGTLKVPAHKYYNPKYELAIGGLPEDTTRQDLINKMEESIKMFGAEGNPVDEDNEMETFTPQSSLNSRKGTKLICLPSKKKLFTIKSRKSKRKGDENEGGKEGEGESGPSTTTKLTSTIEDIAESPEEPTAESQTSEKTKSKKKKKITSSQSEDQGMFNRLMISDVLYILFSLDFGLIKMLGNVSHFTAIHFEK